LRSIVEQRILASWLLQIKNLFIAIQKEKRNAQITVEKEDSGNI
jgi:hypothetical protein